MRESEIQLNPFPDHLTIHFDGSCEPRNPGGVETYGYVISGDKGKFVKEGSGCSGDGPGTTNNKAEYAALGFALRFLSDEQWIGKLEIYGDSKLVVNQVNRIWNCNKEHLQKLRDRILELLAVVAADNWTITWIPRERNEHADSLSQAAYERQTGRKYPERIRK